MSDLAPLHHQLRLLVQRWLPIALSRAGAGKAEVEHLRGDTIGTVADQIAYARDLARKSHETACRPRGVDADLSWTLVELTDRLAVILDLGRVDLDAAIASVAALQRDLIGCVLGVEIREPRPRAVTPSWAQVPLALPVLRG